MKSRFIAYVKNLFCKLDRNMGFEHMPAIAEKNGKIFALYPYDPSIHGHI